MSNEVTELTETERDDLCDAIVGYTGNRAASAPVRFDRYVVPTVERILAKRVMQARREGAADELDLLSNEAHHTVTTNWLRDRAAHLRGDDA